MSPDEPSESVIPPSPPDGTSPPSTSAGARQVPYPRRGVVRVLRFLLLFFGWYILLLYIGIVIVSRDRLRRYGITALHHIFGNVGNLDKVAWSYAIDLVLLLLLLAGVICATRDMLAEWAVERERQRTVPRVPFAVQAEERWQRELAVARTSGDRQAEGWALGNRGFWLARQGRYREAQDVLALALAIAHEYGNHFHEQRNLFYLANIAAETGDDERAENLYREGLAITRELDDPEESADGCAVLGEFLTTRRRKHAEGYQLLAEAERRYGEMGAHERGRRMQREYRAREQEMRELLRQLGEDEQADASAGA